MHLFFQIHSWLIIPKSEILNHLHKGLRSHRVVQALDISKEWFVDRRWLLNRALVVIKRMQLLVHLSVLLLKVKVL